LALREERGLWVFENRVLRKVIGPKIDELTREWRRLHNEELNDLYSSPNIIRVIKSRRMRCTEHVARLGEKRAAYRILVGRHEGRQPLGRPMCSWEDNIKMDLQEVVQEGICVKVTTAQRELAKYVDVKSIEDDKLNCSRFHSGSLAAGDWPLMCGWMRHVLYFPKECLISLLQASSVEELNKKTRSSNSRRNTTTTTTTTTTTNTTTNNKVCREFGICIWQIVFCCEFFIYV
jgi:hypothetical protein